MKIESGKKPTVIDLGVLGSGRKKQRGEGIELKASSSDHAIQSAASSSSSDSSISSSQPVVMATSNGRDSVTNATSQPRILAAFTTNRDKRKRMQPILFDDCIVLE
jgi:hypothetical protein